MQLPTKFPLELYPPQKRIHDIYYIPFIYKNIAHKDQENSIIMKRVYGTTTSKFSTISRNSMLSLFNHVLQNNLKQEKYLSFFYNDQYNLLKEIKQLN